MDKAMNVEGLAHELAEEIAGALSARLGRPAPLEAAPPPAGKGWLITMSLSGLGDGRLQVWLDPTLPVALTGQAAKDDAVATNGLRDLFADLAAKIEAKSQWTGLSIGEVAVSEGAAPTPTVSFRAGGSNGAAYGLVVACTADVETPRTPADDRRLEAVLDVDLPLVVRFGRTVMPLRALADLGPGAVIDMGRSPDDPVDLLVGDRLIARGEVVIVAGNYGVRITELVSGRDTAHEMEGRG